jgi:hypothetical protein
METEAHFLQSTLRERIVEHVFIGDALRSLWRLGVTDVEVLRSEFDAHGYDLVMARGSIVRHIQFKTGTSKPRNVSVALALGEKPSGCVIFIQITSALEMGPFYWFGGPAPDDRLPPITGYTKPTRTTPNKAGNYPERQNHRNVPVSAFQQLGSLDSVLRKLFGSLSVAAEFLGEGSPVQG